MALIKCKECKNMISRDATICPHCGKPRPKNRPGCTLALIIVVVLAIYGAISSTQESGNPSAPKPAQSASTSDAIAPAPAHTENSTAPTVATTASPQTTADTLVEPKWDERMSYWKDQLHGSFKQPGVGQNIEVILTSGVVHRGILKELTDKSVTLQIEQGTLTFDRINIRQDSRLKIFIEDYITRYASDYVKSEKEAYRARILERQQKEQQEREAVEKAQQKENIDKLFSAWDGSLYSLVHYIKKSMNDPKSFDHIETRYSDNGTDLTVYMKFRGKNAFGALVINSVMAKVDYEGNVISILATDP